MHFTTSQFNTTSSNPPPDPSSFASNFICLIIASLFFGGNYLPVKHYETGDGYFFQLIVCISIWICGLIVNWFKHNPRFYALPLLGGFIWTSGNVNSVPVIKCLGIGLGSLFWNIVGLVIGWGNARFGWFGVKPEVPSNLLMNYSGVILCVLSIVIFLFVDIKLEQMEDEEERLLSNIQENQNAPKDIFLRLNPKNRRILGTILSIFTGSMFGLSLTPILYLEDNYENASHDYNDYAFSYSTGILLGGLLYFVVYCTIKKNKPDVYPESILPGFLVGALWQIANTCFFIVTNSLSQAITFPIMSCGPCAVALIIGLLYKEIKGIKNVIFTCLGILLTVAGSLLCSLSK